MQEHIPVCFFFLSVVVVNYDRKTGQHLKYLNAGMLGANDFFFFFSYLAGKTENTRAVNHRGIMYSKSMNYPYKVLTLV